MDVARHCDIQMKESGCTEEKCRCPFCGNGRGKMTASINKEKGLFHCFRCGEGLNAITLYAKIVGTSTQAAYKELLDFAA
jgi:DNA primase